MRGARPNASVAAQCRSGGFQPLGMEGVRSAVGQQRSASLPDPADRRGLDGNASPAGAMSGPALMPTRRDFLRVSATGIAAAALVPCGVRAADAPAAPSSAPLDDAAAIRAGLAAAVAKNLEPSATQKPYPGHFCIVSDGRGFGAENTWPGLDSWQMAGAYLLLGRTQLVVDYFKFVRAAQRKDGNIPFAIFSGDEPPSAESLRTYLRRLRYPQDVFTYDPHVAPYRSRKWVGLFHHWIAQANPLGALGTTSHILTAAEIFSFTHDVVWLADNLASLEAAARFLLTRRSENGLISGSGFYLESPPRREWDGVAQCYVAHAWRKFAALCDALGNKAMLAAEFRGAADALAQKFRDTFWRGDHFGEYVHPQRGLVDSHGVSDVNWAAAAFDLATPAQADALWPRMMAATSLWHGDMPTLTVSKPFSYEEWEWWESQEDVGFAHTRGPLYDVAAMGRVWYLEVQACLKRGEKKRVRDSVVKVCRRGLADDGFWFERYHPLQVAKTDATGPKGYCEYPAILARTVLGNPQIFPEAAQR